MNLNKEKVILCNKRGKPLFSYSKKKLWTAVIWITVGLSIGAMFLLWIGGDL